MNPILSREVPIPFSEVRAEHVEPGLRDALDAATAALERIVSVQGERTYDNTLHALEDLTERLGRAATIVSHLNSVRQTPALRDAYAKMLPDVSAFHAKLPTNDRLWQALKDYAASNDAAGLTGVRKRLLEKTLREFRRNGADLPAETKARVESIRVELAQLGNTFQNNLLDGTNAFELVVDDEEGLAGLPPSALRAARASAESKGRDGYRFTLHLPSFSAVMKHADDRDLRRTMFEAYAARGAHPDSDNTPLIGRILELRSELAELLGFPDYASLAMEERMVKRPDAAMAFERDLAAKVRPHVEAELAELEAFARERLGLARLEPWDLLYVTEHQRRTELGFDQEELRPYLPASRVLAGLFDIVQRLFGIRFVRDESDTVWHEDVEFYRVFGADGAEIGAFYADWYPREDKRGGAWLHGIVRGGPRPHGFEPNLGIIAANFTPPEPGREALLAHDDVETLFHEFGHLLHHMLSRVEIPSMAGTSVARDFVELPSQIMENWTWERDALRLFARHVDTGEPLPDALYEKLIRMRAFGSRYRNAHHIARQLALGTVDLELHTRFDPAVHGDPLAFGHEILKSFGVRWDVGEPAFLTSFSHIFTSGYAAGYYSYMWCEVLEADAFARFKEEGIFDPAVGRAFVDAVLSRGDSDDPDVLFEEFRGRPPSLEPLLERELGAGQAQVAT